MNPSRSIQHRIAYLSLSVCWGFGLSLFIHDAKHIPDLGHELFHEKRIVCAVSGSVLGGQYDLTAKKAIGLVMQGGQRSVAEA